MKCGLSNYKWQFHIFLLPHSIALRGIWLNGANFWMEIINTNCKLLARKFKIKLVRYQITTELPPLILSCLLDPQVCCLSVFFWFCGLGDSRLLCHIYCGIVQTQWPNDSQAAHQVKNKRFQSWRFSAFYSWAGGHLSSTVHLYSHKYN